MRWVKRPFDLFCASVLAVVLLPLFGWIAWRLKQDSDGPVLYISERMKTPEQGFGLFKFRTMAVVNDTENAGVTGADKNDRITEYGAYLRRKRLDELPQLWNIVLGHMSFVGPRPPLREYVNRFPGVYTEVLKDKPGVTGLASLTYSKRESVLLERCTSAEETDQVYTSKCIPAKAKLDLMYQANYRPCLDYWIIWETLRRTYSRQPKQ
jgi:lipopolysaccharide/colanic/teichoic acid biosynthesis glycosyltransferase